MYHHKELHLMKHSNQKDAKKCNFGEPHKITQSHHLWKKTICFWLKQPQNEWIRKKLHYFDFFCLLCIWWWGEAKKSVWLLQVPTSYDIFSAFFAALYNYNTYVSSWFHEQMMTLAQTFKNFKEVNLEKLFAIN